MSAMKDFVAGLKTFFQQFSRGFRERSVSAIERELKEEENVFALTVIGSLSGMPVPPGHIGISLLPFIEHEIKVMMSRSHGLDDRLAEWADLADL
jgi:hypothetical protein